MKLFLLIILVLLLTAQGALALEISGTEYRFTNISFNNGGGPSSSLTYQLASSMLGDNIGHEFTLRGSEYETSSGTADIFEEIGEAEEEQDLIEELRCRSDVFGSSILEATWQRDTDPYFYWSLKQGVAANLIQGFSVSLDIAPDNTIETNTTSYQFPDNHMVSGKHTFYVVPIMVDGTAEQQSQLKFEIWVDVDYPIIGQLNPQSGLLITDNHTPVSCSVYDRDSGFDRTLTSLSLNNSSVYFDYNKDTQLLSYTPAALSEGKNNVLLKAYDLVGNYVVKAWDFVVDTQIPTGAILINNGEKITHSATVFINVKAEDFISGVKEVYLSNDGVFDTELSTPFPYSPVIRNWLLAEPDVDGAKSVYARFKDAGGNLSGTYKAEIELKLMTPQTRIIFGPASVTEETGATFKFESSKLNSLFSYKLDSQAWSSWVSNTEAIYSGLADGNHYFYVKGGVDLNGDGEIGPDEEDSTPAQWIWTISKERGILEKLQRRILFWRR